LDQSTDPNKDGVKNFWHTMQASEFVTSQVDISSFVDSSIYEAALNRLIEENPQDPYWKDLQKVFVQRNS
jgi:NitT/TauT family transport system substrate-binding protein